MVSRAVAHSLHALPTPRPQRVRGWRRATTITYRVGNDPDWGDVVDADRKLLLDFPGLGKQTGRGGAGEIVAGRQPPETNAKALRKAV
jgi:hypothetical protein